MNESIFRNSAENLERLQHIWTTCPEIHPQPLGNVPSMGYGDRIGLATPGHLHAHLAFDPFRQVAPIFAQQSAREMERLSRSPVEVMLDAVNALRNAGSHFRWGADADHLKTEEQVASCVEAGFTFFTADPSDAISTISEEKSLEQQFQELCDKNPGKYDQIVDDYLSNKMIGGTCPQPCSRQEILKIFLVYSGVIERIVEIYGWIKKYWRSDQNFDFEVSVDETPFTTSPLAHWVIARELHLRGIHWTSLAPRFPGEFQKGVEYEGDLIRFQTELEAHQSVCEQFGGYRLSIHSGSDKFLIYPILRKVCGGRIHLKTSGTSYLEALRVVARHAPSLFRRILVRAKEVFEVQRASYHLRATLVDFPATENLEDETLEQVCLDSPLPRQILHVCFGPILAIQAQGGFKEAIQDILTEESSQYAEGLVHHFGKHFTAFPLS